MNYIENEIKILDVNVQELTELLEKLGAQKVFDDNRIVTSFDDKQQNLQGQDVDIRITEEGSIKLSLDQKVNGKTSSIKLKVSRVQEMTDFLSVLGVTPVSKATSHRISYEFEGIDFDIDQFEHIPPFLEIDMGESVKDLHQVIKQLGLGGKEQVSLSTQEVFKKYGKDYLTLYKLFG